MMACHTGFAVVHQWRVRPGMEAQFHEAWRALTSIRSEPRGSRLQRMLDAVEENRPSMLLTLLGDCPLPEGRPHEVPDGTTH